MPAHDLYKNKVILNEEDHVYLDDSGKEYLSFSRCVDFLCPKFDKERVSGFMAKEGLSQADIIGKWDKQRDEGTRLDNALTLYAMTGCIKTSDLDLQDIVKRVLSKYKDFHRTYEQIVVYNEDFRTAGSLDKLGIINSRKTSGFKLYDFKRFEGGITFEHKGQKWLNYPFNHLLNSRYNKIAIQLSFYAWHLENLTERKCEGLFIDVIQPILNSIGNVIDYNNYLVPVNYMRSDISVFLHKYKDEIVKKLDAKPIEISSDYEF